MYTEHKFELTRWSSFHWRWAWDCNTIVSKTLLLSNISSLRKQLFSYYCVVNVNSNRRSMIGQLAGHTYIDFWQAWSLDSRIMIASFASIKSFLDVLRSCTSSKGNLTGPAGVKPTPVQSFRFHQFLVSKHDNLTSSRLVFWWWSSHT